MINKSQTFILPTSHGKEISRFIDHTLLKPDVSEKDIEKLCEEALFYNFAAVCVTPVMVVTAASCLAGSNIKVCTVVSFPFGTSTTTVKQFETEIAIQNGAREIDMVAAIWAIKESKWRIVEHDIKSVVQTASGITVKVIIETCLLNKEEIKTVSNIIKEAGAHYVKTSTGFSTGGATIADITLIRKCVGENFGIKASGGIKTFDAAIQMIKAGANRIGTSSAVAIVTQR